MVVRFLTLGSVLLFSIAKAHILPFVASDYATFCERTVPSNQRQKFNSYSKELCKRIASYDEIQKESLKQSIYKTALQSLETNQKKWACDINCFLTDLKYLSEKYDNDRSELRDFLYLYGSYETFQASCKIKPGRAVSEIVTHDEKRTFFDVIKIETQKIAHKVGNWFQSVRTLFS